MNKIIFKNWAFRFMIWILIINVIIFYLTVTYVNLPGVKNGTASTLFYLGLLSSILLLFTIIFMVISIIKKERRNYKFWMPIIGILILGIIPLMANFI
jgi:hypothetical protein